MLLLMGGGVTMNVSRFAEDIVKLLEAKRNRTLEHREIQQMFRGGKPQMDSRTDEAIETIARVLA